MAIIYRKQGKVRTVNKHRSAWLNLIWFFLPVKFRFGSKLGFESWFLKINLMHILSKQVDFSTCDLIFYLRAKLQDAISSWAHIFWWSNFLIRGQSFIRWWNFQYEVKFSIRGQIDHENYIEPKLEIKYWYFEPNFSDFSIKNKDDLIIAIFYQNKLNEVYNRKRSISDQHKRSNILKFAISRCAPLTHSKAIFLRIYQIQFIFKFVAQMAVTRWAEISDYLIRFISRAAN